MNKFSYPALILFLLLARTTGAQTAPASTPTPAAAPPPATEIFILDVASREGLLTTSTPARITESSGYNNQPMFLPGGQSLLYTSIRGDKQADIYRFNSRNRTTTRMTETSESEYSPTVTPDGKFFSVIRVEVDGTQRLWKFPLAGGAPMLVLEKIKPVGYHVWIDAGRLMLFVLGTPNTMQLADARTQKADIIADNIGRSLQRIPRQDSISFVHKISDQEWVIKAFDVKTRAITSLIKTLPGSEDYTWTPQGILLMAKDSKLFKWNPAKDRDWQQVTDFSAQGLNKITRLAISPKGDKLALVTLKDSPR